MGNPLKFSKGENPTRHYCPSRSARRPADPELISLPSGRPFGKGDILAQLRWQKCGPLNWRVKSKVRCFTDTSFLCALYREQDNTERADTFMEQLEGEVIVSSQVLWEFRQSARFQVFRYQSDKTKGFSKSEAERMIGMLAANVKAGGLELAKVEWPDVHSIAETLSATHTMKGGHRPMDIIHLSTAKHLGLKYFLTFDGNQKKLAEAEGFVVPA